PQNTLPLLAENISQHHGVNARQRNIGTDTVHYHRAQHEPQTLLEFFCFTKCANIDIGGETFCCGGHLFHLLRVEAGKEKLPKQRSLKRLSLLLEVQLCHPLSSLLPEQRRRLSPPLR